MDNGHKNITGMTGLHRVCASLQSGQCLLGIDSGKQRWGIALSDDALQVALPLLQHTRGKYAADLALVQGIVTERNIGGISIGLPLHMDGSESPRAQAARQLARDLEQKLDLKVALWDERLSSVAMQRAMISEADLTRKKRRKSLDKLAANFILQGALDAIPRLQKENNANTISAL